MIKLFFILALIIAIASSEIQQQQTVPVQPQRLNRYNSPSFLPYNNPMRTRVKRQFYPGMGMGGSSSNSFASAASNSMGGGFPYGGFPGSASSAMASAGSNSFGIGKK